MASSDLYLRSLTDKVDQLRLRSDDDKVTAPTYYHGLKVQGIGELALCDVGSNPLRIRKGGVTYGIELVDTSDSNASLIRIKTSTGIKAIRKYT